LIGDTIQSNFTASKLGGLTMPANGSTPHQNLAPQITATGYTTLFGNTDSGSANADGDLGAGITQTIGHHTLHYGAEAMDVHQPTSASLVRPTAPSLSRR